MPEVPLTHRERVKMALAHESPDHVPMDFGAEPEVWQRLQEHFGTDNREEILQILNIDFRVVSFDYEIFCRPPHDPSPPSEPGCSAWKIAAPDGITTDVWGAHRKPCKTEFGIYYELCNFPLADAKSVENLKNHNWPKPEWWDFGRLNEVIDKINPRREYHLRYRIGSIFEAAWSLRRFDQFLSDLILQPELAGYIMDRINEVHMENLRRVMEIAGDKIDMTYTYDDLGHQHGLLMSPETWKNTVGLRQKELFDLAKSYGKPLMYHCCGDIREIVDDLIDMGVDVLNPIQPQAWKIDFETIKKTYGSRLTLHGAIDIQGLLPEGLPKLVAEEAEKAKRILGAGGGYILAPAHHIQPDTPVENILALYGLEL